MKQTGGNGEDKPSDQWSSDEFERLIEKRNKEAWRSAWGRRRRKRAADREWYETHPHGHPGVPGGCCYPALVIGLLLGMAYVVMPGDLSDFGQ